METYVQEMINKVQLNLAWLEEEIFVWVQFNFKAVIFNEYHFQYNLYDNNFTLIIDIDFYETFSTSNPLEST